MQKNIKKTSFCIICQEDFNDKLKPSLEHIIPESIGGGIKYYCLCTKCNIKLGKYDAKLTNYWFIRAISQLNQVKGKKQIPDIFKNTKVLDCDKPDIEYNIQFKNNKPYPIIKEKVKIDVLDHEIRIRIHGIAENIDRIMATIEKTAVRKNIIDKINLNELREKIINEGKPPSNRQKVLLSVELKPQEITKSIVKIAFEMSYFWLGESYQNDSIGKKIHEWLCNEKNYSITDLATTVEIKHKSQFENYYFNFQPHNHIIFFKKNGNSLICFIQIYDYIQVKILISINSDIYVVPFNGNPLLINDAIQKRFYENGFFEYITQNTNDIVNQFNEIQRKKKL